MNVLEVLIKGNSSSLVSEARKGESSLEGLKRSTEGIGKSLETFGEIGAALGLSFAAFGSIGAGVEALNKVFETGKELRSQARMTGESITNLVAIKRAYDEAGMEAGNMTRHMEMLDAALGGVNEQGEPNKKVFEDLGISMEWLKTLDYPGRIKAISDAMANLSHAQKSARMREMFGKGGFELMGLVEDPKIIKDAQKDTSARGSFQQEHNESFTEVANTEEKAKENISDFFLGMGPGIADAIKPLLEVISKLDMLEVGQSFARGIDPFVKGVSAAAVIIVDICQDIYNVGAVVVDIVKGIIGQIVATVAILGQNFSTIVSSVGKGIKDGFLGAVESLAGGMISALAKPISYFKAGLTWAFEQAVSGLSKIPGLNKLLGVEGHKSRSFDEILAEDDGSAMAKKGDDLKESGKKHFAAMNEDLSPLSGIGAGITEAGSSLGEDMDNSIRNDIDAMEKSNKNTAEALSKLFSYQASESSKQEGRESGSGTRPGSGSDSGKEKPDTDRLARIGGFIGGGGRQIEDSRKTAEATATMAKILQQIQTGGLKMIMDAVNTGGGDAFAHP